MMKSPRLRFMVYIIIAAVMALAWPATEARSGRIQPGSEREFVGTINNNLRVRIRLSQTAEALTGSYFYERIGKRLRLEGRLYGGKEFQINEFDEQGHRTGEFDGKFATADWIEGTWSSADGKRQMPFSAWVLDGRLIPAASSDDQVSGQYRRIFQGRFDRDQATLNVWLLKDGRVRVAGDATWVGDARRGNVHVGEIDGVFPLEGRKILYRDSEDEEGCRLTITLGRNSLVVTNDNLRCGGVNVNFDGEYRRVGPPRA